MHIGLNGTNIEQVTYKQFLGVTFDEKLTWREQYNFLKQNYKKA